MRRRLGRVQRAILRQHLPGHLGAGRTAGEGQPRDGGNTGQPLATKTQRADMLQIVQRANLAGGVAVQRQGQIVGGNAAAVVVHPNQADAALGQIHRHPAGASVDAVFQQLFQRSGRALHHLASGNLVDQMIRQALDARTHAAPRRCRQISITPGRMDTTIMPRINRLRLLFTTGILPNR